MPIGKNNNLGSMRNVYLKYGTLISPIGNGINAHFNAFITNTSGLNWVDSIGFNKENLPLGKISIPENNSLQFMLNSAKCCFIYFLLLYVFCAFCVFYVYDASYVSCAF